MKPDDYEEPDFSRPAEETETVAVVDPEAEPVPEPVPEPYTYVDLQDGETAKGWCCEKAGNVGVLCGSRNIGGKTVNLVPDSWTPKSSNFASDDLAMVACP